MVTDIIILKHQKTKTPPEKKRRNFVVSSFMEGEGHHIYIDIDEKKIRAIGDVIGTDIFEDISLEHPVEIKEITDEQQVESMLNGASIDGAYSKTEQIRYYLDEGDLEEWQFDIIKAKYPNELHEAQQYNNLEHLQDSED